MESDLSMSPTPVSPWTPSIGRSRPRRARVIGTVAGLTVAGVVAALNQAFSASDWAFGPGWPLTATILLAGGLGGCLVTPLAWRAQSLGAWIGASLVLAVLAVVIGDAAIAGLVSLPPGLFGEAGSGIPFVGAIVDFVLVFVLGLMLVGPFAAVTALPAAAIWASLMWFARRSLA